MNNQFTPDHEEILIFFEENISKLVRLKVASKAKYEAYDESLIDYLTADSINDEERAFLSIRSRCLRVISLCCGSC